MPTHRLRLLFTIEISDSEVFKEGASKALNLAQYAGPLALLQLVYVK